MSRRKAKPHKGKSPDLRRGRVRGDLSLQTDPIGYGDGLNWYAYVGNDPVNFRDPTGLQGKTCRDTPNPGGGDRGEPAVAWTCDYEDDGWRSVGRSEYDSLNSRDLTDPFQPLMNLGDGGDACLTPAALTPDGDTKGNNPKLGSGKYNTDLPGGWSDAAAVFAGLSILADQPGSIYAPVPWDPTTIARSTNTYTGASGAISLRVGIDKQKGVRVGVSPRIDIQAGVFGLTRPETIHFRGGKGDMCPSK